MRLERVEGEHIIDSKKDLFVVRTMNDFCCSHGLFDFMALQALVNAFSFMYNQCGFLVEFFQNICFISEMENKGALLQFKEYLILMDNQ